MKLTKSTDGAARILVLLAQDGPRLSAAKMSQILDIPFNHVAKILQSLARAGIVRTFKGKGGGVEAAVSPEVIRLDQIVEAMEGPLHLMECTLNPEACPRSTDCRLSAVFRTAQEEMMKVLQETSIQDLIRDSDPHLQNQNSTAGSQTSSEAQP